MSEANQTPITASERNNILAKEWLSINDIQRLMDCDYCKAAEIIRDGKRMLTFQGKDLRCSVQGRIHIQDYIDAYNLDNSSGRYNCQISQPTENLDL